MIASVVTTMMLVEKIEMRREVLNAVGFGSYLSGLLDAAEAGYLPEAVLDDVRELIAENNLRVVAELSSGAEPVPCDVEGVTL